MVHKITGGQVSARNARLEVARGDYVCYVDSDDYLIDNKVLERLLEKCEYNPDMG